ncbi:MAG: hypothetical protein AB1813_13095 [Verrucomicrobiota bacterium]|jgi:hypothetical protein
MIAGTAAFETKRMPPIEVWIFCDHTMVENFVATFVDRFFATKVATKVATKFLAMGMSDETPARLY